MANPDSSLAIPKDFYLGNADFKAMVALPESGVIHELPYPDYDLRVENTLRTLGLEPITQVTLDDGRPAHWPTTYQQVQEFRSRHKNTSIPNNRILFAWDTDHLPVLVKIPLNPEDLTMNSLQKEAEILSQINTVKPDAAVPKCIRYVGEDRDAKTLPALVTSAYLPMEAQSIFIKKYKPAGTRAVATSISSIEGISLPNLGEKARVTLSDQIEMIAQVIEKHEYAPYLSQDFVEQSLDVVRKQLGFENQDEADAFEAFAATIPNGDPETFRLLAQLLAARFDEIAHIVVTHGDSWVKNILLSVGGEAYFVDWPLAGPGYQGQDAGRTGWDFGYAIPELFSLYAHSYIHADSDDPTDIERRTTRLKFGIVFEAYRWLHDRYEILAAGNNEDITHSIADVEKKALWMLTEIGQSQQY